MLQREAFVFRVRRAPTLPGASFQSWKPEARSWQRLRMYRTPMGSVRGLAHGFRHRRVRMNRANELFDRALETQGERRLGDQLRRAGADHVNAEDLVVLLVEDNLDEPFRLAGDSGTREHPELEAAGLDLVAPGLRLPLGEPHAPDFRIAVGAARNLAVVDRAELEAGDALGQRDALGRREVRQLRVARLVERDDVADRGD